MQKFAGFPHYGAAKLIGLMATKRSDLLWHLALTGLLLALIWTPSRFLTQDGPSHLYTAKVFRELLANSAFQSCYQRVSPPPPNSLTTWMGALLVPVLGNAVTEKIWATAYVLLFVSAGAYLASVIHPGNCGLGIYLFVLHPFVLAGFWNFNLALGVFLLGVALTIRFFQQLSLRSSLSPVLLGICLYLTHLFVFTAYLAIVGLLLLVKAKEGMGKWSRLGTIFFYFGLFLMVAGGSAVVWHNMRAFRATGDQIGLPHLLEQWARISFREMNVWYRYGEQRILPALQATVLLVVLWRTGRGELPRRYAVVLGAFLVFFFFAPDQLGVAMAIKARLWLLVVIFAALCLPSRWTPWIGAVCALLLCWHLCHILPLQLRWNRQLNPLLDASKKLEGNQVQASLMGIYWGRASLRPRVYPFVHVDLLVAAESEGISMSSNQILSAAFPVRYSDSCKSAVWKMAELFEREVSSPDVIVKAVAASQVRYVVIEKAGTLPWPALIQRWRVIVETPDFVLVDTKPRQKTSSVMDHRSTVIGHQPSVISHRSWVIGYRSSVRRSTGLQVHKSKTDF